MGCEKQQVVSVDQNWVSRMLDVPPSTRLRAGVVLHADGERGVDRVLGLGHREGHRVVLVEERLRDLRHDVEALGRADGTLASAALLWRAGRRRHGEGGEGESSCELEHLGLRLLL